MAADMLLVESDRGPWLYREPRISRGREIQLLKLRTLRTNVLAQMPEVGRHARLLEAQPDNLTWAGRHVLKRWYLDELPQLVNVLRGDISLVGPRPWPPELVRYQLERGYDYRLHAIAGWTGPAQVRKGRPVVDDDFGDDVAYVAACHQLRWHRLVRLDLRLLLETARTVLRGEGLRY
jgi:lipopolysaccharide/colanic/teichoic acid biosynthesis glycosyltransferase